MTTHRTDICTGKASHEQLALPDGGRITYLEQSMLPVCRKKELSANRFSFSLFPVCVPQSFRAASFIYNLFVLAVVCQCFFLRHFLPSAHAFLTSISDSLAKLLCTAHSFLPRSLSFFMQNKQHLLQTALHY